MKDDKNKTVLENITVDGTPLVVYVREEERKEVDKVRESDMRKAGAGVGYSAPTSKFGNVSGTKSTHGARVVESEEVKAHLNYLNQQGGMKAVNDFLSKPTVPQGSIESVLKEHEEKVRFYLREQQRIQIELAKHQAVVDSLKATLDILTGKAMVPGVPRATNGSGERAPRKDLLGVLKTILMDGPMTRKEIRKQTLILVPDIKIHSMYAMVASGLRAGIIEEVGDDKVQLVVEN